MTAQSKRKTSADTDALTARAASVRRYDAAPYVYACIDLPLYGLDLLWYSHDSRLFSSWLSGMHSRLMCLVGAL